MPGTPPGQPGMTMIGYGQFRYLVKSSPVPVTWPVLGLALQKNYISLYISPNSEGAELPFACAYSGRLGRAKVSTTGVVTFSSIADLDLQALAGMITAIATGLTSGQLIAE